MSQKHVTRVNDFMKQRKRKNVKADNKLSKSKVRRSKATPSKRTTANNTIVDDDESAEELQELRTFDLDPAYGPSIGGTQTVDHLPRNGDGHFPWNDEIEAADATVRAEMSVGTEDDSDGNESEIEEVCFDDWEPGSLDKNLESTANTLHRSGHHVGPIVEKLKENIRYRQKTFCVRKKTLLKQARLLSIITNADVKLTIKSESGRTYSYESNRTKKRHVQVQVGRPALWPQTAAPQVKRRVRGLSKSRHR